MHLPTVPLPRLQSVLLLVTIVLLGFNLPRAGGFGIDFTQVDWLFEDGTFQSEDSDYGNADILLSASDMGSFSDTGSGYLGFLNLVTSTTSTYPGASDQWAIENFPIFMSDISGFEGRLPDSFFFDLDISPSQPISQIDYSFSIDAAPLPSMPTAPLIPYNSVISESMLYGGLVGIADGIPFEGGTGHQWGPVTASNSKLRHFGDGPGSSGKIQIGTSEVEAINEDPYGCVPGAAARSLAYLEKIHPEISIDLEPQDMYKDLYKYMETNVGGKGTSFAEFKIGKDRFSKSNSIPVTTEIGVTDVDKVIKALKEGADVEFGFFRGIKGTNNLGGHCAFVSQVDEYVDADGNLTGFKVTFVDDSRQGDGIAKNKTRHLIFDKDGNLEGPAVGTGAKLIGFAIQTIPEPHAASLAFLGLLAAAIFRHRRTRGPSR